MWRETGSGKLLPHSLQLTETSSGGGEGVGLGCSESAISTE